MLAIYFRGNDKIEILNIPVPKPKDDWVVVKIRSASICGTDRVALSGPGQATIPGHENAGEVFAVDKPTRVKVGDRVALNCHVTCGSCEHCLSGDLYFCKDLAALGFEHNGGFAEYILVPEACCTPLPSDISFEIGSLLVDMLGTPFRAVKRARLMPGQHVAVWGAGPIGLGALMSAKRFGVKVASIDLSDSRLSMAKSVGADMTINPKTTDVKKMILDWTDGRGLDVAFECVGNEKAAQQGLENLKKRGALAVVGVSKSITLNTWEQLICREITVFGSRNYNTSEFSEMVGLVRTGLPVEKAVTHRFPLDQAEEAFRVFRSGEGGKILLVNNN
jgi:2-desacetyl-2-hydroxyethyl bacteriochlorophyllide A dehydrogenase